MGCRCRASACRARRDQAAFVGVNDFWTRSQSELLQDLGHLDLGRRSTNYKLAADLQVGQPSDEQVEHKALFMSGYPGLFLSSRQADPNAVLVEKTILGSELLAQSGQVLNGYFPGYRRIDGAPDQARGFPGLRTNDSFGLAINVKSEPDFGRLVPRLPVRSSTGLGTPDMSVLPGHVRTFWHSAFLLAYNS